MGKMTEEQKKLRQLKKLEDQKLIQEQKEKERLNCLLLRDLKELRDYPLTYPKYSYSIGEKVSARTANWNEIEILEILDNGKIFKVNITSINEKHGKINESKETRYISHLDIIPKNLELRSENFGKPMSRSISFHNTQISSILHYHYRAKIDYNPIYQRDFCWSLKDKENLINSIFNSIEIGKFVLVELPFKENSPNYEILDGKQRLNTLIEFYEDKFKYNGFFYSELSKNDKDFFLYSNTTIGIGKENMSDLEKMEYFIRLNTTGVPQSEQHLSEVKELIKKERYKSEK